MAKHNMLSPSFLKFYLNQDIRTILNAYEIQQKKLEEEARKRDLEERLMKFIEALPNNYKSKIDAEKIKEAIDKGELKC